MLLINLFYIISLSLAGSESCFCGGSSLTRTLADNVFGRRCVPCRRSVWLLSMKKRCFYSAYTPNQTAYDMIGDWLLFKLITSAKFIKHWNATDIVILKYYCCYFYCNYNCCHTFRITNGTTCVISTTLNSTWFFKIVYVNCFLAR